ncbi:MAG: GTPase [Bacillota bacterium]
MTEEYCRGCGAVIQTADPGKPGFVPENVFQEKGKLICRRCYRMIHYGEAGVVQPEPSRIKQSIAKAVSLSDLLIIVVDFSDLTGTLPVWSGTLAGKPYILAVNKSDLLPSRTKQPEIKEYLHSYLRENGWEQPRDLILTSGLKGGGVEILAGSLNRESAPKAKIGVLGVANVGKSSLIKRLLSLEGSKSGPTVSKFPGTTMGLSNWSILKGRNTLIDTPGLVTGDRLGDLLCPECAGALVSLNQIGRKLWGLKPGKALIIGGLFGVKYLGANETVLITFNSPELAVHRTDNARVTEILAEGPSWLMKICRGCRGKISWREDTVRLGDNQDLSIAGLGWISQRGPAGYFQFILPEGVRWEIRRALVGKR